MTAIERLKNANTASATPETQTVSAVDRLKSAPTTQNIRVPEVKPQPEKVAATPKKDFDLSDFLVGTIKQGGSEIAQAGGNTLSFLEQNTVGRVMGALTGDKDFYKTLPFYTWNENIKKEAQSLDEKTKANTEAGGKAAQIAETLGAGAIAAVPQLIAAVGTGGTSIAANGLAATSAAAQASPTLLNAAKNVAKTAAKNPQYWTSFLSSVGNDYESAKQRGFNDSKASLYALGTSLMNAAIETGGGIQTLPKELQSGKSAFRTWVDTMIDEGKEGAVQGVISRGMENVFGADNPIFSVKDENAVFNPVTIGKDAALEVAVGGILSAVPSAINASRRNSAKGSPATQIAANEGSNAPKENVAQNASKSDSRAYTQEMYKRDMDAVKSAESALAEAKAKGADATRIAFLQANVDNAKSKIGFVNDGLGAADAGFDPFTAAQNQYGTLPSGEKPVRSDDVPVSVDGKTKVSQSVVTAKGAKVTPDSFVPLLENKTMKNGYSFVPISNDESVQAVEQEIMYKGWDQARADWTADVRAGKSGDKITAMGALLYNNAVNAGDYKTALDIFADYQQAVRNTARGLQAARILKSMTPSSRLYMIQKSIQGMVDDLNLPNQIVLPDNLVDAYVNAKTDKDTNDAVSAIQQYVADQIPATFMDKWTALRYTNMLGNFKTPIRNTVGNVTMRAVAEVQNALATFFEKVTGGKYGKTRSVFVPANLRKAAASDFEAVKTQALGESKYSTSDASKGAFAAGVKDKQRVFNNSVLEGYRKLTQWVMNNEYFGDTAFVKSAYARYLSGYLHANGVTADQMNSAEWQAKNTKLMDKARDYAIKQAQEVTFRDSNVLSDWVSNIGRKPNTPKAVKAISEGVLPFRKTPANVLLRAEEYSPLGLINTAIKAKQAAGGNATSTDVINALSKSLTGTGLFVAGMQLVAAGVLRAGGTGDEKQDDFDELTGNQNYSLVLPNGTSITLDWLSPASIPLFMGAEFEALRQENGIQLKDIESAVTSLAEPMVQMSMLQGVDDTLAELKYSDNSNLMQIAATAALGYLTQGLTNSLVGQISRSLKEDSMMTYVDKDSPLPDWLQREIGAASRKFPGDGFQQIPYIDAWGQTESTGDPLERAANNLFNPSYVSKVETDRVERELQRVYDAVGSEYGTVFPQRADKSFEVNGKTKNLTADEYVKYAQAKGKNSYRYVQQAINNTAYKSMRDNQKAELISEMYGYANYKAKKSVARGYESDTYKKYAEAENAGMSPAEYYVMKQTYDYDNSSKSGAPTQEEAQRYLDTETNLSREQKADLWLIINNSWTKNNPYD